MIRDSNKMKYKFFFVKMDANTEKLKGTQKNENNRRI
jgi:hypothetical protein